MPSGKWPARWKYPDTDGDKARAIWEALKPARDYLEGTCGEFVTPEVGDEASNIVTRIDKLIMDHAIPVKSDRKIPPPVKI